MQKTKPGDRKGWLTEDPQGQYGLADAESATVLSNVSHWPCGYLNSK